MSANSIRSKRLDAVYELARGASSMMSEALLSDSFSKFVSLIEAHKDNQVLLAAHRRYLSSIQVLDVLNTDALLSNVSLHEQHELQSKTIFLFNDLVAVCDDSARLTVSFPISVTFVRDSLSTPNCMAHTHTHTHTLSLSQSSCLSNTLDSLP
jgi:hypothetical protein